jgi:phospholipase/lecithinase/hemolysin
MVRFIIVLAFALLARPAFANYSSLYVFGDSLSDGGNAYALAGTTFLPPPYAQRFSNGPVAVEYLASQLGIAGFGPSVNGGTNYAVGGATTGAGNFNFAVNSPPGLPASLATTGMLNQVGSFVGSSATPNPEQTLYVVWGGPNDFFLGSAIGANPAVTAQTAIANLATELVLLAAAKGAQHIVVNNMPNLGSTPLGLAGGASQSAALTQLTLAFNAGLAQAISQVEQLTGIDIIEFSTFNLLNEILADPLRYGFTNVTGRCIDSLAALQSSCQGYLFFDSVHPTTAAHQIIGSRLYNQVPEPVSLALGALALLMATAFARGRRERRSARR